MSSRFSAPVQWTVYKLVNTRVFKVTKFSSSIYSHKAFTLKCRVLKPATICRWNWTTPVTTRDFYPCEYKLVQAYLVICLVVTRCQVFDLKCRVLQLTSDYKRLKERLVRLWIQACKQFIRSEPGLEFFFFQVIIFLRPTGSARPRRTPTTSSWRPWWRRPWRRTPGAGRGRQVMNQIIVPS